MSDSLARYTTLIQEILAETRAQLPEDSPELAGQLAAFSPGLLRLKAWDEAEPFLLEGYEGLKDRETVIPPQGKTRIPEALDRLIELYIATNKPEEVAKWQAERAKYPDTPREPEKQ